MTVYKLKQIWNQYFNLNNKYILIFLIQIILPLQLILANPNIFKVDRNNDELNETNKLFLNFEIDTTVYKIADFKKAKFYGQAIFKEVIFHKKVYFNSALFNNSVSFDGVNFYAPVTFDSCTFNGLYIGFTDFLKGTVNLRNILSRKNTIIENSLFNGYTDLRNSIFMGDFQLFNSTINTPGIEFDSTIFYGKFSIDYLKIKGSTDFDNVCFGDTVSFSHVDVSRFTNFRGSIFQNRVYFYDVTFQDTVGFFNSYFLKRVEFNQILFNKSVIFQNAKFQSGVSFSKSVIFNGYANFRSAKFYDSGMFINNQFDGISDFKRAYFKNFADFNLAKFKNLANFNEVYFGDEANFIEVSFDTIVSFINSNFNGVVDFSRTQFGAEIDFKNAKFFKHTNFNGTSFKKVSLKGTIFSQSVDFRKSVFVENPNLSDTKFNGEVDFRDAVFDVLNFKNSIVANKMLVGSINGQHFNFNRTTFSDKAKIVLLELVKLDLPVDKIGFISFDKNLSYYKKKLILNDLLNNSFSSDKKAQLELKYIFAKSTKYQKKTNKPEYYNYYEFWKILPAFMYDIMLGFGYRPFRLIYSSLFIIFLFTLIYFPLISPELINYFGDKRPQIASIWFKKVKDKNTFQILEKVIDCAYLSSMLFFSIRLRKDILSYFHLDKKFIIILNFLLGIIIYLYFIFKSESGAILFNIKNWLIF